MGADPSYEVPPADFSVLSGGEMPNESAGLELTHNGVSKSSAGNTPSHTRVVSRKV